MHVGMYRNMYVCIEVYIDVCIDLCMHVGMYVCMYACMYVCMYVSMYVCMYVCMYACVVQEIVLARVEAMESLLNGCSWGVAVLRHRVLMLSPLEMTSLCSLLNEDIADCNAFQSLLVILVLFLATMEWHVPQTLRHHHVVCFVLTALVMQSILSSRMFLFSCYVRCVAVVLAFLYPTFGADTEPDISRTGLTAEASSLGDSPHNFFSEVSLHNVCSLATNGDGNCSIHSVLGKVDERCQLRFPDPANWAHRVLTSLGTARDVQERCIQGGRRDIWNSIFTLLSNDLLLLALDANYSAEVSSFRACLQRHAPHVFDIAKEARRDATDSKQQQHESKTLLLDRLRWFFNRDHEENWVKPIMEYLGFTTQLDEDAFFKNSLGASFVCGTQDSFSLSLSLCLSLGLFSL